MNVFQNGGQDGCQVEGIPVYLSTWLSAIFTFIINRVLNESFASEVQVVG